MPTAPIPNLWANLDPTLAFEDASMRALLDYWHVKRGARRMPARRDIDPLEIKPHLGHICLIDVEHAPLRLRYRLIGDKITRAMGRDSTGRYYDEVYPPDVLASFLATFRWLVDQRRPLRSFGRTHYPDRNFYRYEILNMPLSDDDATVNMVLGKLTLRLDASGGTA